ncbi:hypothetical protein [Melaminivora sp.]
MLISLALKARESQKTSHNLVPHKGTGFFHGYFHSTSLFATTMSASALQAEQALRSGHLEQAAAIYQQAVTQNQADPQAHLNYGQVLLFQGKRIEALPRRIKRTPTLIA